MPAHDHPLAADNDADHLTQEDENLLNYFDEFEVFKQLTDIVAVMMREKPTDPEFFLLAQLRAWDASEQALGQPYYAASRYHLDGQEDGTRTPERERKEHTDALFNAQWYQIEEQRIAQQNERAKEQQAMFLQEVEAQAKKTNAKMEESEPLHNLLKKSAAFTCTQGTPAAAEDAILEVVNSLEPLTTFTVLQQLVRMGIITDAWELPMSARNYVSSSDDFTPLFHNMRFAYESPLHHYGEASPPSEAARLPPLDVPRLCFTIAHRIVTGDLAATKSEFADAHDVAHLQRVEDLVEGRQRSTNFAIHARTQFHPGCLQSLLQFRLMVRLAHMWLTVLTHPPSEWLRLLRITLYSLMGYDGYTVVPAMISVLLPLMVEDVAVEIDRQLGEDTDAADLLKVAFHVGIRCLGAMTLRLLVDVSSPAAAMLLQQSSSGKVVADQLSLGAAMRLGSSSKSTMELPDFSTVTSANALRTELLSCRGALTHSTPARHLHRIVRSLHDCTCGDIADELLTYGFMDRDDLASLFAIILRLTRPSQYDGCSMQHAYIEKMNDACVEELTHRARLVKCFVEVMMIAQHMSTSRMMNERVLDAATLACTSLPSVFRRTETSPTHTLAEMIHARFPQGSLEDAQRTLDTIIAMMEGSVDLSRALFQLSMSGILIIHYPELCQTMCAYIQETESRPRVLLLSRWFLSVRYHYLCRMPCKLQTGQPRMENSRSYTTGHTNNNNNNNTAADLPSRTVVGESQSSGMDPRDPLVAEISRCFKSSDVGRFVDAIRNPIDKRNLENPSQFLSYPLWNYLELGNAGRDHQRWCRVVMEKVQRFREHRVLHSEVVTVATTPLRVVAEIESQLLLHQRQELESIEPDTLGGASSFYPSPASEASKTQLNRGAATPLAIYASTYCANVMGVILMELITSEFPRYVVEEVKLRWRRYGDARREAMLTQALNDVGHGFQSSTFPDARRRLDKELTNFFSGNITIESVTEIVVMLVMCGVLPCRVNKFFAVLQREINRSEMSVPPYFHFLARRTIVFLLMHIDAKVLQYVEQHDAIFDSWEEFLIDPSSVFDCSRALLESIPSDYSHRADVVALRDRLRAHAPKQLRVFAADATLEDRMEFGIWFMLHAALPPSYSETVVLTFLDTFLFRFGSDAADPQQGQQGSSKTASKYDMLKLIQHVDHIYRSIIALTQPSMATLEHLKNILVVSLPKMGSTVDVNTKRGPSNYDLFDGGSYVASTFLTYDAFLANYGQCYQDDASAIAVWGRSALCVQLIDAVSAKFRVAEEWFAHAVVEFLSDFTLVLAHVQPGNEVFHFRELIAHQLVKGCTVEILKNIIEQLFITLTHLGVSVDPRLAGIMKTTLEVHMERALDDLADCTSVITKVVEGEDAAIDEFQNFCHSRGTHMPVKRVFVYYNLVKSLDSGSSTNNNNGGGGASSTKRGGGGGAEGGEGHAVHLLDEEVLQCVASKDSHKVIRQVFRNIYHFFAVMSMELSITRYSVSEKRSTLSDRSRVRALLLRDVRARTGLQMIYLLSAGSYATGLDMLSHYGKFVEHRYNVRCSPLAVFAWTRSMASLSELVYGFLVEYFCPRKPPFDDVLRLLPENFSSLDMTLPMSHLAVMEKDNNPSFMDVKRYKYMAGSPSTYYLNLSAVLYDYLTKVEHRKDSLDTCIRLRQVLEGSASDLVMSCLLLLGAVHEWSPQFRENFWSVQTAAAASIAGHPGDASYGGDASAINTAGRDVSTSEQNRARSRRNISISNYFMIYTQRLIMDYDEWMRRNFEGAIVHRRSTIGLARSVAHSLNNFTQFEEGVPLAASVMVPEISDELMLALLNALLGAVDALDTPELRWESDGGIRYSYSIRRAEDAVLKSKASAQRRHELRPPVRLLRMDLYRPLLYSADLTEVMLAIGATPRDISALGFLFAYALRDSRLTGDGEDSNNVNAQEGAGSEVESSTAKTSTSARMAASLLYIHPSKNIHHRVSSVGLAEVDMLWSFFLSLFNDGMRRLLVRKHLDIPAEARLAVATKFCEIEPLVYIELLKQSRSNMWCASPDLGQLPSPYVDMWQMHTVLRSTGLVEAEVAHRLEAQKIMAKRPPPVEGAEKRERNVNMDEANALVPRDSVLSDVVCEEIMFDARHPHCFSFVRMLLHTMRVSSTGEDRLTNASILLRCIYKRLVRGRGELTKVVCLTAKECDEVARMWHAVMLTQNGSGQNSIQAIADFVATSPEDRATLEMVLNNIDNFIRMHLKAVMNWRTLLCVMCSFLVNADLLQQHQHSYVLTTRWAVIAQSICMALAYGGVSDQMQLLFLRILRSVRMAYEILERLRARENMFAHLAALPYGMMINYLQRPGSMQNLLQASSAWDSKKPVPTSEMRTLMDHMENALKSMEMITLPRPLLENTGVAARPMANNRELLQTFLQWIERCQSISKTGIPFERMALVLSGSMAALEEQSRQTEGEAGMLQLRGGMWNATAQEYIRLFMCLSVLLAKQLRILFSDPTKPPTASSLCAALRSDDLRVPLSSNGSNNPLDPNTSTKASKGTSLPKTGSSFSSLPSHTVHATLFTKAFATHCVVSAAERFITGTDVAEAGSPRNNSTELRSMTLSIPNVQVDRRSSINDALSIKERVLRQLMDVIMNFVMDSLQAEDDAATNYTKHRSRMHHLVASPQLELTYRDFCRVCYHLYQDIYYHGRLHYTPETLAAAGHLLTSVCRSVYHSYYLPIASLQGPSEHANGCGSAGSRRKSLASRARSARLFGPGGGLPVISTTAVAAPRLRDQFGAELDEVEAPPLKRQSIVDANTAMQLGQFGASAHHLVPDVGAQNRFVRMFLSSEFPFASYKVFAYVWAQLLPEMLLLQLEATAPFARNYWERMEEAVTGDELRLFFQLLHEVSFAAVAQAWIDDEIISQVIRNWLDEHATVSPSAKKEYKKLKEISTSAVYAISSAIVRRSRKRFSYIHSVRQMQFDIQVMHEFIVKAEHNRSTMKSFMEEATKRMSIKISADNEKESPLPQRHNNYSKRLHVLRTGSNSKGNFFEVRTVLHAWTDVLAHLDGTIAAIITAIENPALAHQRAKPATAIPIPCTLMDVEAPPEKMENSRATRASPSLRTEPLSKAASTAEAGAISDDDSAGAFKTERSTATSKAGASLASQPSSSEHQQQQSQNTRVPPSNLFAQALFSGRRGGKDEEQPLSAASSPAARSAGVPAAPRSSNNNNSNALRRDAIYSMDDVMAAHTPDRTWTVINDVVYDITKFVRSHPGGLETIYESCAGQDGTEKFFEVHGGNPHALRQLELLRIGVLGMGA